MKRLTADEIAQETALTVQALLTEGHPVVLHLVTRARHMAPTLVKDLDPRTPPGALGRGLLAMASDALALVVATYPDRDIPEQVALMANALSAIGVALIELDDEATS